MEEAWTGFAIYTMWEVESFPMWQDYNVVVFSALAYPLVRFSLDTCIYKRLAEWVIFRNGETGFEKRQRHDESKKVSKFMESAWKLTYYTTSVCLAMFISSGEPWIGNTDAFWHGWPHQTLKFRLKIFYSLQCGFYIYSVAALILWETRRKDFKVMMSHHIITIGLISCSYITGYEVTKYVDKSNNVHAVHYYTFNTLLMTLLVIHIYWWILICRMVSKQLHMQGKIPNDVRSDSEED
jgi:cation transport ATPase